MRLLYNNLWDDYDVLSETSEDTSYPVTNTQNQILSSQYRTEDGDISAQSIVMDMGTATSLNCAVISGHNLSSAATIKFEMHTSDAWGGPDLSETLTWRSSHIIVFFTATSKRFCRFYIDDPTNTDNHLEIGRFFIGTYLQVTPSSTLPFTVDNTRNDKVIYTDQGGLYGTPGISKRVFSYDFPKTINDTLIESIRAVYDECGKVKCLYCCNFDSLYTHHDILYGRLASDLSENVYGEEKNTYQLQIEECF